MATRAVLLYAGEVPGRRASIKAGVGLFEHTSLIPGVTPEDLYDWHARPGAFTRLTPPWQTVLRRGAEEPLSEGLEVHLRIMLGPLPIPWVARHRDLEPGVQFVDEQLSGPFARWAHVHRFAPAPAGAELRDSLEYAFRGGAPAELVGGPLVRAMLRRMFLYRHRVTASDLARHAPWRGTPLRVAVTGATGLVGRQLGAFLSTGGHEVLRLSRRPAPGEVGWDPAKGRLDSEALEGVDAVIHLAGESISGRWTPARKREILRSRTEGTRFLSQALARLRRPPRVLVSASATGYYGDRGEEPLTEDSPPGQGFLADVCRGWEAATSPAEEAGIRVVQVRTGVVLTPAGGALRAMLPAFLAGLGGPVGNGRQALPWISLDDLLGVLYQAVWDEGLRGPLNGVAGSVTNREFGRTLGRVLGRPACVPLPAAAVRLLLGEMGQALLLEGAHVVPQRLRERDFRFAYPTLEEALRHELGRGGP